MHHHSLRYQSLTFYFLFAGCHDYHSDFDRQTLTSCTDFILQEYKKQILHGDETMAFGDAGYQGVEKREAS